MSWPESLSPFRKRAFFAYFLAQTFSAMGTWAQATALGFLVLNITGSASSPAVVAGISAIPPLLAGPFTGALADRINRRALLAACQLIGMATALIAAALLLANALTPALIYVLAGLVGVVAALEMPVTFALSADMNSGPEIRRASTLISSGFAAGRILGSALAGILLANVSAASVFLFNALTYVPSIVVLLAIVTTQVRGTGSGKNLLQEFGDGLRYVRANPRILDITAFVAVYLMVGFVSPTLFPAFNRDVLGDNPIGFGNMLGATGAGNLIGALFVVPWLNGKPRAGLVLLSVIAIGAVMILSIGLFARNMGTAMLLSGLMGVCGAAATFISLGLVGQLSEAGVRGRVLTTFNMAALGAALPGALIAGVTATAFGAANALVIHGAIILAFIAGVFLFRRAFVQWRVV